MKLKCKINGKEYSIVQGCTFVDNYNETLDSGTIILSSIPMIEDMLPGDDVFIWNADQDFYGFKIEKAENGGYRQYNVDSTGKKVDLTFYKHLKINDFSEELINLKDRLYKYKISLVSEIKNLEKVCLPNSSVTQPLKIEEKNNIWILLNRYVDMYSPQYKAVLSAEEKTWKYEKKYYLSEDLKDIFSDVYSPEFTLNLPSLRDLLTQLMIVKDRIPYVLNNVIYAIDLTERKGEFNKAGLSFISGSRSSENHYDSLRRTYSNALSSDNTCHMVEYLGFRNKDNSLMTIENMRLETSYPIYKINKIYACYYKHGKSYQDTTEQEFTFLCKQDITPLVLPDNIRNALSQDWDELNLKNIEDISSVTDLAKYKLTTLGYSMGSNYITGWGTKYTYMDWWWNKQTTYIQNILMVMDRLYPYGVDDFSDLQNRSYYNINGAKIYDSNTELFVVDRSDDWFTNSVNPFVPRDATQSGLFTKLEEANLSVKLKSLIFIVDYEAFYSGTLIHSKDDSDKDDLIQNDNSSSSLTILETDGIQQKEKINRLGNKGFIFKARYDGSENKISSLQQLGSIYSDENNKDVVIYSREYAIWDNYIEVNYEGTKNYVLKNYFTSVFAKYRLYNLMSYEESTYRAENIKKYLFMSTQKQYYENSITELSENSSQNDILCSYEDIIKRLVSAFFESGEAKNNIIDKAVISYKGINYYADVNKFASGNSICFNTKMYDNVTMGIYIARPAPLFAEITSFDNEVIKQQYTGSEQAWYFTADNNGFSDILDVTFLIGKPSEFAIENFVGSDENDEHVIQAYKDKYFVYPKNDILDKYLSKNKLTCRVRNKDNKELIDVTMQFETITDDSNIVFSPWFNKLNNLLLGYFKTNSDTINREKVYYDDTLLKVGISVLNQYNTSLAIEVGRHNYIPLIRIKISKKQFNNWTKDISIKGTLDFTYVMPTYEAINDILTTPIYVKALVFECKAMKNISETGFTLICDEFIGLKDYNGNSIGNTGNSFVSSRVNDVELKFARVGTSNTGTFLDHIYYNTSEDERDYYEYIWPSNIKDTTQETENSVHLELPINIPNYDAKQVTSSGYIAAAENIPALYVAPKNAAGRWVPFYLGERIDGQQTYYPTSDPYSDEYVPFAGAGYSTASDAYTYIQLSYTNMSNLLVKKNMFVYIGNKLDVTKKYQEYNIADFNNNNIPNLRLISNKTVDEVFKYDEQNSPRIHIDLTELGTITENNSIQYWYFNEKSLSYVFVFGVNITQKDIQKGYIDIYLSLITLKDKRIYDELHNVVGDNYNYINDNEDGKKYGTNQYYNDIINNKRID
ncbi:hypothetical protein [Mammaliicoccus vitulinus]|uniref:hypothetical protein n=1 Tax=Mammaliicoccus vitulinus TaxID=71237 RepID=UPI00248CA670|nr:hypothetical protein [Mammaliicoccus vitulinus]